MPNSENFMFLRIYENNNIENKTSCAYCSQRLFLLGSVGLVLQAHCKFFEGSHVWTGADQAVFTGLCGNAKHHQILCGIIPTHGLAQ